jgi:ZIP family zinc transporter
MSPARAVAADRLSRRTWGWVAGAVLLAVGLLALHLRDGGSLLPADPKVRGAFWGGMMAFAATALGTLPVLLAQRFSQRVFDTMLGFGAGVMLAASAFSLIIPALAAARDQGAGRWEAGLIVSAGVLGGAMLLLVTDRLVPHEHFVKGREGPASKALRRSWLFVLSIVLHNIPEGLSIGVAFGGTQDLGARALATGISIQDVPEGMVVAMALRGVGYGRVHSATLGALSGLVEPVAAVLGAALIGWSTGLLPWGLAAAAGAMLFVISHEIIPESHREGHEAHATTGLMVGFVLMMLLDNAAG